MLKGRLTLVIVHLCFIFVFGLRPQSATRTCSRNIIKQVQWLINKVSNLVWVSSLSPSLLESFFFISTQIFYSGYSLRLNHVECWWYFSELMLFLAYSVSSFEELKAPYQSKHQSLAMTWITAQRQAYIYSWMIGKPTKLPNIASQLSRMTLMSTALPVKSTILLSKSRCYCTKKKLSSVVVCKEIN